MPRKSKVQFNKEDTLKNIQGIIRHIRNVQDNGILLGERLIEAGEIILGKNLIANVFKHDNSKFYGIEWQELAPRSGKLEGSDSTTRKLKLNLAVLNHVQVNLHHPEAWESIHHMPRLYLAEMACDVKSRSEEFATSLKDWIEDEATKKYNFSKSDKVYKDLMYFVDLLCEQPFAPAR